MKTAFGNTAIVDQLRSTGIVPLFTPENAQDAFEVIQASYDAGIRVFEMTNRRPNSYDVFVELIQRSKSLPGLMLGIGTIMDGPTTKKFIDAGAAFIISPIMNIEIAIVCREHDMLWIPGCATPTEIITAKQHGAAIIKLFPGAVLGPQFVSSILAVAPDLQLMITGGVEPTRENLSGWFKAGATCVGLGSNLFSKQILTTKDWGALQQKIVSIVSLIEEIRDQAK